MKNIFKGIAIGVLLTTFVAIAATSLTVKEFLNNIQVNTTQLPKGWVRWKILTGERACTWIDLSRWNEASKKGWMSAWDYIFIELIPKFGSQPLTAEQAVFCYADWDALPVWNVKPNGTMTERPTYDLQKFLADGTWVINGRVSLTTLCGADLIRKTPGYEYHKIINSAGVESLTACVQ